MTSLSHRYPDFGTVHPPSLGGEGAAVSDDTLEDIQLASFDAGYQAGWEDAVKANTTDVDRAAVNMAQNLQDMSFSHHEAYLKLSSAMKPLLRQILDRLLPKSARQMVGMHILEQLTDLMDGYADKAIEIVVSPNNLDDIQNLLNDMVRVPFALSADEALTNGQAFLRVGEAEREINLDAVLSGISEAVDAFYDQTKEEMTDG